MALYKKKSNTYYFYLKCRHNYEITKDGKVFSLNYSKSGIKKQLKQFLRNGYYIVDLSFEGKSKTFYVHQLVCFSFLGKPMEKQVICHRNDIRNDNRIENLYYGTQSGNMEDARKNSKLLIGEKASGVKLTNKDVIKIREEYFVTGYRSNRVALSKKYNVHPNTISSIINRQTWSHI